MNTATFRKWEATLIAETVYALFRGQTHYSSLLAASSQSVPEHQTSKPATPKFYELAIPLFRFFGYPGGRAIITPGAVAAAVKQMADEGIDSDWEEHLEGRSPTVFATKRSGYLERITSKEVARCAEILHAHVGVTRAEPLPPKLVNPFVMTYRVFSAELSDEHVVDLSAAAESGEPIKFRGQPHVVKAVQGGWSVIFNRFDTNYDLERVRK